MKNQNHERFPWPQFFSELVGTALLVGIGLSLVTLMFGSGSPLPRVLPSEGLRRLIAGILFGTTGALIALSPVGKVSGAHINPVVTLGFHLMGKLDHGVSVVYVVGQLTGACFGALPLLAWGLMGRSVAFGATLPGQGYAIETVLLGEAVTTFIMVSLLAIFLGFRRIRPFTPAMFPFLYAIMVYVEAPVSGTSTNPARSLGPAIVSGQWQGWWVYWVGPVIGTLAAVLACSLLAKRIEVAKLYHFDSDRDGLFRRKGSQVVRRDARAEIVESPSLFDAALADSAVVCGFDYRMRIRFAAARASIPRSLNSQHIGRFGPGGAVCHLLRRVGADRRRVRPQPRGGVCDRMKDDGGNLSASRPLREPDERNHSDENQR